MKNRTFLKLISLILTLVMALSLVAGCSSSGKTGTKTETKTEEKKAETKKEEPKKEDAKKEEKKEEPKKEDAPESKDDEKVAPPSGIPSILKTDPADMYWMHHTDPITLKVYVNTLITDGWQWGNDVTTKYITERTGVNLEMEYAPDNEGTRLNLMLAGGEELPDIFHQIAPNSPAAGELIKGNYVLCAEDLINEYAPEMWDLYSPFQKDYAAAADGKMWGFVNGYEFDGENHYGYMHGYIGGRADILEELGYSNLDIKTLDTFMTVLDDFNKVWKTDYPDIVYPVLMRGVTGQFSAIYGQVACNSNIRYNEENNSCYFWFQSEAGKNTLKFYNNLFHKGYLPEEAFITTDSSIDLMGAGKVLFFIAGNTWESSSANAPLHQNVSEDAYFMPIYPFSAVGEEMMRTFKGVTYNGSACWVSADSKNPDRALGFIEYMTTEEGILTTNMGIYGTHWDVTEDDDGYLYPQFIDEVFTADVKVGHKAMKDTYGINNYEHSLWFFHANSYNFLWNYDVIFRRGINPDNLLKARNIWYSETTDNADLTGVPATFAIDASSDAGVALAGLQDIFNSELAKIVFAASDAEFESMYDNMIAALQAAGEENFWKLYQPMIEEKLTLYKAALASH